MPQLAEQVPTFVGRDLLNKEYIADIIEKYNADFDEDIILNSLEKAIVWATKIVFKNPAPFVVWDGLNPTIYLTFQNNIKRISVYSYSFFELIGRNLNKILNNVKLTMVYTKNKDIVKEIVVGKIKGIYPEFIDLEIKNKENDNDSKVIRSMALTRDLPKNERKKYVLDYSLFFYVKRLFIDRVNKKVEIFLSRNSKEFVTLLFKYFIINRFTDFYKHNGRYPTILCIKRVPGIYSNLISDIFIPKNYINEVRDIIGGERITVELAERKNVF